MSSFRGGESRVLVNLLYQKIADIQPQIGDIPRQSELSIHSQDMSQYTHFQRRNYTCGEQEEEIERQMVPFEIDDVIQYDPIPFSAGGIDGFPLLVHELRVGNELGSHQGSLTGSYVPESGSQN